MLSGGSRTSGADPAAIPVFRARGHMELRFAAIGF